MRICIIGIGGAIGSAFGFELQKAGHEIIGIDKKEVVQSFRENHFLVFSNKKEEYFKTQVFSDDDFSVSLLKNIDILFFAVKNPLEPVLKFYFSKIKENNIPLPSLFFIQNGLKIRQEVLGVLNSVFGKEKAVKIYRGILLNPIIRQRKENTIKTIYSLPLKIMIALDSKNDQDLFISFGKNFRFYFFPAKEEENLEYSKLFLNLIGIPSATHQKNLITALKDKEIFKEEVFLLKEYVETVKRNKGRFLNLPGYPVSFLAFAISFFPFFFFFLFKRVIIHFIFKKREGREKSIDEIDAYVGKIILLAKKENIDALWSKKILERGLRIISENKK